MGGSEGLSSNVMGTKWGQAERAGTGRRVLGGRRTEGVMPEFPLSFGIT